MVQVMPAKTELQKMIAGEPYNAIDSELVVARARARELYQSMIGVNDKELRRIACELFGAGGDTVGIAPPFFCDYGANIELGEHVFFNVNCVVLDAAPVRIGSFTMFGPAVQILTSLHPLEAQARRHRESAKPIEIGPDVWVGGGAIILPGVKIGARAVIGAGSVVTEDVPEGVVAVGNPCRVTRQIG